MRRSWREARINSTASLDDGIKLSSVTSNRDSFLAKSSAHLRILSQRLPRCGILRRRSSPMKANRLSLETPAASLSSLVPLSAAVSLARYMVTASVTMWLPRGPAVAGWSCCLLLALSGDEEGLGEDPRVMMADFALSSTPPLLVLVFWLSSAAMVESEAAE